VSRIINVRSAVQNAVQLFILIISIVRNRIFATLRCMSAIRKSERRKKRPERYRVTAESKWSK